MRFLGIETSCDDTGVSLYDSMEARALFEWLGFHEEGARYGGVVPELSARSHLKQLVRALGRLVSMEQASEQVGTSFMPIEALKSYQIEAIAYTAGPGLSGPLLVGAQVAQIIAWALEVPLFPIDHLEAHLFSPFIGSAYEALRFPFLGLLASGGHTQMWQILGVGDYRLLGSTRDDAAGEALDKAAKMLGLGYPGGAALEKLAKQATETVPPFPIPKIPGHPLDFSFSGLKTALRRRLDKDPEGDKASLASAFQEAISQSLRLRCRDALYRYPGKALVVVGGVSANHCIRDALKEEALKAGRDFYIPSKEYTGDNGTMIAYLAYLRSKAGLFSAGDYSALNGFSIYPTTKTVRLAEKNAERQK